MNVTLIRTIVLYFCITVAIRLMGKRQIGDLQPGELVVTLLISEIAAIPLQDTRQPMLVTVAAILLLCVLELGVSALALKCAPIRRLLSGGSVIVLRHGVPDQAAMRKVRMTVLDLTEQLRAKGYPDLTQVDYAVLEVDGTLSVLPTESARPLTVQDTGITPPGETGLPMPVISDGHWVKASLRVLHKRPEDLQACLEGSRPEDIFLMTVDQTGRHYTVKKEAAP